jgi:hypothetical protein
MAAVTAAKLDNISTMKQVTEIDIEFDTKDGRHYGQTHVTHLEREAHKWKNLSVAVQMQAPHNISLI